MKNFVQIDNNNAITQILVVDKENPHVWLNKKFGGTWINSEFIRGIAAKGHTYSPEKGMFIPPKPFESWVLNEEKCDWFPPIEYPDDDKVYIWNEETVSWIEATE